MTNESITISLFQFNQMCEEIEELRAYKKQQQEKTGHWEVYEVVGFGDFKGTEKYKCSECGEKVGVFKSNFCPNCGKRMVSDTE